MEIIHLIAIINLLTVIFTVNAFPQQQNGQNNFDVFISNSPSDPNTQFDPNAQSDPNTDNYYGIFDPTQRPTRPPRPRPSDVITPDPTFVPTTSPQMMTINEETCTCVPYHMCDPRTNRTKTQASDDEVTGWGKINIRFDPYDCQAVLDVCCFGVDSATIRDPAPPMPPPPRPPTAGCGVRNVGGLDFEVEGADVSSSLLNSTVKSKRG